MGSCQSLLSCDSTTEGENAPQIQVTVGGLNNGSSYAVHGRYASVPSSSRRYGLQMAINGQPLVIYDKSSAHSVIFDWGIWADWESCLGVATVSGGSIRVNFDDAGSSLRRASWTGLRLVRGSSCN